MEKDNNTRKDNDESIKTPLGSVKVNDAILNQSIIGWLKDRLDIGEKNQNKE